MMFEGDIGECAICKIGISPNTLIEYYEDEDGNLCCEECYNSFKVRFKRVKQ